MLEIAGAVGLGGAVRFWAADDGLGASVSLGIEAVRRRTLDGGIAGSLVTREGRDRVAARGTRTPDDEDEALSSVLARRRRRTSRKLGTSTAARICPLGRNGGVFNTTGAF